MMCSLKHTTNDIDIHQTIEPTRPTSRMVLTIEAPRERSEYQIPSSPTPDLKSHDRPNPTTLRPSPRLHPILTATRINPDPKDPRASSINRPNSIRRATKARPHKVAPAGPEVGVALDPPDLINELPTQPKGVVPFSSPNSNDLLKSEIDIPRSPKPKRDLRRLLLELQCLT